MAINWKKNVIIPSMVGLIIGSLAFVGKTIYEEKTKTLPATNSDTIKEDKSAKVIDDLVIDDLFTDLKVKYLVKVRPESIWVQDQERLAELINGFERLEGETGYSTKKEDLFSRLEWEYDLDNDEIVDTAFLAYSITGFGGYPCTVYYAVRSSEFKEADRQKHRSVLDQLWKTEDEKQGLKVSESLPYPLALHHYYDCSYP